MAYQTHIPGLIVTNNRIDGLMADFSGWKNLEKTINDVLKKARNIRKRANGNVAR